MKLTEGLHDLTVGCPRCGRLAMFPVEVTTELKVVSSGDSGRLSPKFSTKSVEHNCEDPAGDQSLPFVDAAPDIVDVPLPAT
jgi:hypothetical protein